MFVRLLDRSKFRRWARMTAARNNYDVACRDIAGRHPALGGGSQMAAFMTKRAPPLVQQEPAVWTAIDSKQPLEKLGVSS